MFYRINFETTALNNAKWFTVHFSQSAPVVSHTTLLESHRSRRFGHFRVLLAEFVPSESLRAYDSCSYCQESANYRKQVFTSICAKKAVEYRQTCGNTYARIWRFFYRSSSNVIFRHCPVTITARKDIYRTMELIIQYGHLLLSNGSVRENRGVLWNIYCTVSHWGSIVLAPMLYIHF